MKIAPFRTLPRRFAPVACTPEKFKTKYDEDGNKRKMLTMKNDAYCFRRIYTTQEQLLLLLPCNYYVLFLITATSIIVTAGTASNTPKKQ